MEYAFFQTHLGGIRPRLRELVARYGLHASVVLICLVFSAMLWTGLFLQLNIERERIIDSKRQENDNLARVFEEHVARTIRAAEVMLQEIESEYRRYGTKFDLVQYAKNRGIYLDPYNILSIVDENGDLILANFPLSGRINLRKTDSYQHHARHDTPEVFISAPRTGTTTGKWTVYLSVRINKADGSFGGLAAVGMDPGYFSRIYTELDLGKDSVVSMIGRDGIIRARSAGTDLTAGQNLAGSEAFTKLLATANHGSFIRESLVDRITRINSYRALKDYPLVVLIGTSKAVALSDHDRRQSIYMQAAGGMTAVILCLGLFTLFQIERSERANEGRRHSERLFRTLADGAPVGIFRTDAAGKCVYVNGRWCDIAGMRPEAALDEGWAAAIHPDDRERVFKDWEAAANNQQPFLSEYRFQTRDGTVTWVVGQARAETDSKGTVLSYVGTITDITERREAEKALRESEERLRLALMAANQGLYDLDLQTGDAVVSPEYALMLGYRPEEFRETNARWRERLHPDDRAAVEQAYEDYVSGKRSEYQVEFRQKTRSGDWKWTLSLGRIVEYDKEGRPLRMLGTHTDIARHKQAEETIRRINTELEQRVNERTAQLETVNKDLEAFTYSVSHDLKAPLRGIDGYSRLLLQNYSAGLDDEGRRFLHNVRRATLQMNQLIDDLLAYSRLERRVLQTTSVNVQVLIDTLLAECAAEVQNRGSAVTVSLPCATVRADRDGLAMALRNLLDNALKFSRDVPQPAIEIGGRDSGASYTLWVRDNGTGFDMKFHDRIFDMFQRLHRAEDYPGTGVGLAIVRKAMERMGGRTWAESEPGKGATFFLEIPL